MPLDLQRLARVRAHLMAAAALATAGCGSSGPDHTINEPVHINRPPDQQPTGQPTPDQTIAGPAPSAAPSAQPEPQPPAHVNKPRPDKP